MHRSLFLPASERAQNQGPAGAPWPGGVLALKHGKTRAVGVSDRLCRFGRGGFLLASLCLLAGCIDNTVAAQAPQEQQAPPSNIARRSGVSPSGATVALASFTGAPDGLRERFDSDFDSAAKTQDIVMATPKSADYLVRGYLSAVPEDQVTALTYVLDVFDAKKHRTQRVEDKVLVKGSAPDPWSVVDDNALAAVAAKSAAALAAVLTNTPQAIAAAEKAPANGAAAAPQQAEAGGHTVVAATPPAEQPAPSSPTSLALH